MNRKEFKQAMSGVQSSEQTLERIMDMTKENTKKRIKFAPAIALVACLAILITGVFGGSIISAKVNAPTDLFTITAYACDKKVDLKENEVVKTSTRIEIHKHADDDYSVKWTDRGSSFSISGKEMESVIYYCNAGSFAYETDNSTEVEQTHLGNGGYGSKITFSNLKNDETATVIYDPEEAVDTLLKLKDLNYDCTNLPTDTVTVEIVFKDGTISKQKINISFDKHGYMLMEYIK